MNFNSSKILVEGLSIKVSCLRSELLRSVILWWMFNECEISFEVLAALFAASKCVKYCKMYSFCSCELLANLSIIS